MKCQALWVCVGLLGVGCGGANSAYRLPEERQVGVEVAKTEPVALTFEHAGVDGAPLPLDVDVFTGRGDLRVGTLRGEPRPLWLEPGSYRVMVRARPQPFGFRVVLEPGRPVHVELSSATGSHGVVIETARTPLGDGVVQVDRQILGFGWGPPTGAAQGPSPRATTAALRGDDLR